MTSRACLKVIAITAIILLPWRVLGAEQLPGGVLNDFFWMPQAQRDAIFEKYDIETQYKIYIYGCQEIEPPAIDLAYPFARRGAAIVIFLEGKLGRTDDDLTIRDIVNLFRVMSDLDTYDVLGNKQLMDKLQLKVSGMKDSSWRIIAEEQLDAIRGKRGNEPVRSD